MTKRRLFIIIPILVLAMFIYPVRAFAESDAQVVPDDIDSAEWMSSLPDDIAISDLSIPGAHDAGTCWTPWVSEYATCQNTTIGEHTKTFIPFSGEPYDITYPGMLNDGVRHFDLRIHDDDGLGLYHGYELEPCLLLDIEWYDEQQNKWEKLALETVMDWVRDFLNAHPRETVILEITNETDSAETDRPAIFNYFRNLAMQENSIIWSGDHVPTLGEVRGKVVLFSRLQDTYKQNDYDDGKGGYWALSVSWNGGDTENKRAAYAFSGDDFDLWSQNMWEDISTSEKKDYVYNTLARRDGEGASFAEQTVLDTASGGKKTWFVSYASANTFWDTTPLEYSLVVNPCIQNDIAPEGSEAFCGVLAMDFVDKDLARNVWETNYNRVDKWYPTTYSWSDDLSTCTATHFSCLRPDVSESVTVETTAVPTVEPTCSETGIMTHTADFSDTGWARTQSRDMVIPVLGHLWETTDMEALTPAYYVWCSREGCDYTEYDHYIQMLPPCDSFPTPEVTYDGKPHPVEVAGEINEEMERLISLTYIDPSGEKMPFGHSPVQAGSYTAEVTLAGKKSVTIKCPFKILKRPALVCPDDQVVLYGQAIGQSVNLVSINKVEDKEKSGLSEGQSLSEIRLTPEGPVTELCDIEAGNTKITDPDSEDVTANYDLSYQKGKVTFSNYTPPKACEGLVYNGREQELIVPGSITGDPGQYMIVYSLSEDGEYTENTPTSIEAGIYNVWYKVIDSKDHHDSKPVCITVAIDKADPVANAPAADATYGQTLGDVALINPEGNTPGSWIWVDGSTGVGDIGTKVFKANFTPTDEVNYNSVSNVDVTVTVGKADSIPGTVTANNRVYDGTEQPLVTVDDSTLVGGTMQYAPGKDGTTEPAEGWSTTVPAATECGTYYVWYKVKGDENHNDTQAVAVEVKISEAEVTSIRLRAVSGTTMVPGTGQQLEVILTPSYVPVRYLTWSSSDDSIATVNAGKVNVKSDIVWGDKTSADVVITARSESEHPVEDSLTITVVRPGSETAVTGVKIDPRSVRKNAKPGDTFRLIAVIEPADATDKTVIWESDNTAVAEVGSTGIVTVRDTGDAVITVKAARGKYSDKAELKITKTEVTGIEINKAGGWDYLVAGKSVKLSARVEPADATEQGVSWSGSDRYIAEVDESGTVKAKGAGNVTITAASDSNPDIKASAEFTVVDRDDSLYVEFAQGPDYTYTGNAITPDVNVYYRGKLLMRDTDYSVSYKNNKNANDASDAKKAPTVKVTGKTVPATSEAVFRILPADIGDDSAVISGEVNVAEGKTAEIQLYYGGTRLGSRDFVNPYAKDKFTVSRAITVYGRGNFTGEREIWINVKTAKEIKSLPRITVRSFKPEKRYYNGKPQTLSRNEIIVVSSADRKRPLEMGRDFRIAYPKDVTNAGTVKISVIGMGDYTGTADKSYKILAARNDREAIEKTEITFPDAEGEETIGGVKYDSFAYKAGGVLPYVKAVVTYKNGREETLSPGRDYKVTYANNQKAGAANKNKPATATVTFTGNFKDLKKQAKDFFITQADLGNKDVKVNIPDKTVKKMGDKYPIADPVVDVDGVTLHKNEYTVIYKVNGYIIDKDTQSYLSEGESVTVTAEITARTDKNKKENGNYKGSVKGHYIVTRIEDFKELSKTKVIIQKKDDEKHKAVTTLNFTGGPIVIGEGEYKDYELFVYIGKNVNDPDMKVLTEGKDFKAVYSNNVKTGKATIILNTADKSETYFGSNTYTFRIVRGSMPWVK